MNSNFDGLVVFLPYDVLSSIVADGKPEFDFLACVINPSSGQDKMNLFLSFLKMFSPVGVFAKTIELPLSFSALTPHASPHNMSDYDFISDLNLHPWHFCIKFFLDR